MLEAAKGIATMPESRPKRRWYHITPDRLIVGLLAVEGFLLLSEWFQWFAFNEKKGWTVLIAVAAVCVAVVVMLLWLVVSLRFRWRFQFSLRSLVVLVVAVAIPCGWFALKMREAERQRKAVQAIREAGETVAVYYDYRCDESGRWCLFLSHAEPPTPSWLRGMVVDDFFADVVNVVLWRIKSGDAEFEHLKGLTDLKRLELHGPQVTDDALMPLSCLMSLTLLDCSFTDVTDAGLSNIKGLTRLETLELCATQVTDAGLSNIKGLTRLETLGLSHTQVTGAGLVNLKGLTGLHTLELRGAQISDQELQHLSGLTNLRHLDLDFTHVTEEGIKELRKSLPDCEISGDNLFPPPTTPKTNLDQN